MIRMWATQEIIQNIEIKNCHNIYLKLPKFDNISQNMSFSGFLDAKATLELALSVSHQESLRVIMNIEI